MSSIEIGRNDIRSVQLKLKPVTSTTVMIKPRDLDNSIK